MASRMRGHLCLVGWLTGVEPAAFGITTQRSNQLSYSHHKPYDQRLF